MITPYALAALEHVARPAAADDAPREDAGDLHDEEAPAALLEHHRVPRSLSSDALSSHAARNLPAVCWSARDRGRRRAPVHVHVERRHEDADLRRRRVQEHGPRAPADDVDDACRRRATRPHASRRGAVRARVAEEPQAEADAEDAAAAMDHGWPGERCRPTATTPEHRRRRPDHRPPFGRDRGSAHRSVPRPVDQPLALEPRHEAAERARRRPRSDASRPRVGARGSAACRSGTP